MLAFHSLWTKPNRIKNGGNVGMPDFELLILILSALKWKQYNGPIKMITDSDGAALFEAAGLKDLWSEPIDTSLDNVPLDRDAFLFWAAGKLYALSKVQTPCVMLDTDMIVWADIQDKLTDKVVAAHSETLMPLVYPDPSVFQLREEYAFPASWDFSLWAANTAFLYMPNADLRDYYVSSALRFMDALLPQSINPVVTMCFAEQRILPMCCKAKGIELTYLMNMHELDAQQFVTHLWGYKNRLRAIDGERESFCRRCVCRILKDFPQWEDTLRANKQMAQYLP